MNEKLEHTESTGKVSRIRLVVIGIILVSLFISLAIARVLILDWMSPFESKPSLEINFQEQDSLFLKRFFKENNCYPAFNGEVQCYMANNVALSDQGLVLKAVYEGNDAEGNPVITSGRVDTRNFFHPACGKIEVVASFPPGVGVFAAIWLREPDWLQEDSSLANPAINIVEYQGGLEDLVHFNMHTLNSIDVEDKKSQSKSVEIGDVTNVFRTYSIEWTDESIRYLVDDEVHYTLKNQGDWIYGPTDLIFNLAMGGRWAESVALNQGLETWRGIELEGVGQTWEMTVQSLRYYPLRDQERCQ